MSNRAELGASVSLWEDPTQRTAGGPYWSCYVLSSSMCLVLAAFSALECFTRHLWQSLNKTRLRQVGSL